jgi:predicted nucleic acid-binding protein
MSGTKPKIYYWDACIYLAWLKGEVDAHGKECIDALNKIAAENFDRNVVVITSTLTLVEVLSANLSTEQEKQFHQSFRHQDHIRYDLDPPIALKARDFRERFLKHESGKTLSTPDAIHLATASVHNADEFLTFDQGKKDSKHLGLLGLNKDERLEKLVICRPEISPEPQSELELAAPAPKAS